MKKLKNWISKSKERKVIYGITDRRNDPIIWKINDFLIDHSPISTKKKNLFFSNLHLLVTSGIRLIRALEILNIRERNPHFQRILSTIVYDIKEGGKNFSQSLEKYPFLFRPSETKILYAGEISGRLEQNLETVSRQVAKNIEIELRVRTALMYPFTVFCGIIGAAIIILLVVVPRFEALFSEFPNASLPIATRLLISASEGIKNFWWFVLTLIIAGFFIFRNWKSSPQGKKKWDTFIFKIPYLHSIIQNIQTMEIASNFASLMEAGIPILKSLEVTEQIVSSSVLAESLTKVRIKITSGSLIHEAFQEDTIFDPSLAEVLEIGEQTGRIPEILEKLSDQYEKEVDAQLKNINTLIEPLVLTIMGCFVAFIAFAILTPVFQLQQMFSTVH